MASDVPTSGTGDGLNLATFGEATRFDPDGKDCGIVWEDIREIYRVEVTFAEPPKDAPELQYWRSAWPEKRIPRDEPSGSGTSGWMDVGDWIQGEWATADAEAKIDGATVVYTFHPLAEKEFPSIKDYGPTYRCSMKIRVVGKEPFKDAPVFKVFSDTLLKDMDVEIFWGGNAKAPETWDGRIEPFNGVVQSVEPVSSESRVQTEADLSWKSEIKDGVDGVRARLSYADATHFNSFDEAVFTIRTSRETFSFAPKDLLKWKRILLPDYGAMIRLKGDAVSYAEALEEVKNAKEKDVYTRVFDMPEQTFPRAWGDVPVKGRHYIPLSFEGGRQHFGLDGNCDAYCVNFWPKRVQGPDTERCLWKNERLTFSFGLSEENLLDRQTVDGRLPMTVSVWEKDGVRYTQTAFVTPLKGVPKDGERILGEDLLVLMVRFSMEPLSGANLPTARLVLSVADGGAKESLKLHGRLLCASKGDRMRMLLSTTSNIAVNGKDAVFEAGLNGKPETLEIAIPYVTFTLSDATDIAQLQSIGFDEAFESVRKYWTKRIADGTQISTPEKMINEFYQADVSHLMINCEREVGGTDCYMAKVGTFYYGVYANESCMMVTDLDRRGYNERAEQVLETWIRDQGKRPLPGDYSTAEGEFYRAGGYEDDNGYNQHHGWVLWALAEHYRYTRDEAWLKHAAPAIVKGCDWIVGQRKRTIEIADKSPIRAIERGLLPPGSLEDIGDWRSWMSNNVFSWWGMDSAAKVLESAGHPDGGRLRAEADAYKKDIWAAFEEAMRRSPVVRLRDGSWIPHIPSDVHRRGRSFGWITETLEGAIYLIRTELLDPNGREASWIIRDYEDNLYMSEQYGYPMTEEEFQKHWFCRGGVSQQANLLGNPIPYLLRDETEHFLRAYFNAFSVSYFPDTRMMTEHALPNIGDFRGDHYKTSDESNSTYWLRLMFIMERGDDLILGGAIPRYWLSDKQDISVQNAQTHFGPMSVRMNSRISESKIVMTIDPPKRNAPKRILARFRHPDKARIVRCEVDGKPYDQFDPEKEWVILPAPEKQTEVAVFYK
jgi:hypothetical protein